ncbi:MAG: TIGR00645 family protein [Pseudomonadota bacterium]
MEKTEHFLEAVLFGSRWLMAPFYLMMVGALGMLLVKFAQESWHILTHTLTMTEADAVLAVLSLIDITLTGNLLLMVVFAGYENFVSKMDVADHEDRPDWMGKVDFAGLKLKLVASIVAISGINLLKSFMALGEMDMAPGKEKQLFWMLAIHVVFIFSGVMLAFMDRLVASTKPH